MEKNMAEIPFNKIPPENQADFRKDEKGALIKKSYLKESEAIREAEKMREKMEQGAEGYEEAALKLSPEEMQKNIGPDYYTLKKAYSDDLEGKGIKPELVDKIMKKVTNIFKTGTAFTTVGYGWNIKKEDDGSIVYDGPSVIEQLKGYRVDFQGTANKSAEGLPLFYFNEVGRIIRDEPKYNDYEHGHNAHFKDSFSIVFDVDKFREIVDFEPNQIAEEKLEKYQIMSMRTREIVAKHNKPDIYSYDFDAPVKTIGYILASKYMDGNQDLYRKKTQEATSLVWETIASEWKKHFGSKATSDPELIKEIKKTKHELSTNQFPELLKTYRSPEEFIIDMANKWPSFIFSYFIYKYSDDEGRLKNYSSEGFVGSGVIESHNFKGIVVHERTDQSQKDMEMNKLRVIYYMKKAYEESGDESILNPVYNEQGYMIWPKELDWLSVRRIAEENQ